MPQALAATKTSYRLKKVDYAPGRRNDKTSQYAYVARSNKCSSNTTFKKLSANAKRTVIEPAVGKLK